VVAVLAQPTEIFVTRATEIFGLFLPPVRTLGQQPLEQFCSHKKKGDSMAEYWFKNSTQNVAPYIFKRGWTQTTINKRVKGRLRFNEWNALKLKKLVIKEKLFPMVWKEDAEGNILITFKEGR